MLLGALVAAGAPDAWLLGLPARLGLDDVRVRIHRVERCGVSAVKVDVVVGGEMEGPAGLVSEQAHDARGPVSEERGAPHVHHHPHAHSHAHPHDAQVSPSAGHDHAHAGADAVSLVGAPAATREDHGTVDDDGRSRLLRDADAGHAHPHPHAHTHDHPHGHSHPHDDAHSHGPHRHVGDLIAIVERAPLSDWVRARAVEALRLLGEAEGRVHGVPAERVPLHEVGALDALVDIVGGIEGFEQLGITRIYQRPLALGSGWVRCAHGTMPVPAPATAILVEGLELGPNGPVTGEATTPTGAALLRVLSLGAPPARWRAYAGDAWGAGGRNPAGWPNALRLLIADAVEEPSAVTMLASDLDDLSPEYLEPLRVALAAAGALDVQSWTTQGKKGRAGFRVEAQAPTEHADAVALAFLTHSSTIGVRRWSAERHTLTRRMMEVQTAEGAIRVKVTDAPTGPRVKAEYDDVARAALASGRPALDVARDAEARARRDIAAE